ncbi:MAG: phosphopantetheine-binding protein [Acidobacteriota bacterium]|jgi:acyl carrier protein
MDSAQIEAAIRQVLVDELKLKSADVAALSVDTPLLGRGLGLDSMEVLTLTTALEERFSIQVADAELTSELFRSLSSLIALIRAKTGPPEPGPEGIE